MPGHHSMMLFLPPPSLHPSFSRSRKHQPSVSTFWGARRGERTRRLLRSTSASLGQIGRARSRFRARSDFARHVFSPSSFSSFSFFSALYRRLLLLLLLFSLDASVRRGKRLVIVHPRRIAENSSSVVPRISCVCAKLRTGGVSEESVPHIVDREAAFIESVDPQLRSVLWSYSSFFFLARTISKPLVTTSD